MWPEQRRRVRSVLGLRERNDGDEMTFSFRRRRRRVCTCTKVSESANFQENRKETFINQPAESPELIANKFSSYEWKPFDFTHILRYQVMKYCFILPVVLLSVNAMENSESCFHTCALQISYSRQVEFALNACALFCASTRGKESNKFQNSFQLATLIKSQILI